MSLYRVFIELRAPEGCYWLPTTWNADSPQEAVDLALEGHTPRTLANTAILHTAEVFDIEAGATVFQLAPSSMPLYRRVPDAQS